MSDYTDAVITSLEDALKAKAKYDDMAKRKKPSPTPGFPEPTVTPTWPALSEASQRFWTKPLRIDLLFDDPIKTRVELEILAGAVARALYISKDHERGAFSQLADMRAALRRAMQDIQHRRGKTFRPD